MRICLIFLFLFGCAGREYQETIRLLNSLEDAEVIETYIGNNELLTYEEISARLLIKDSIEIYIGSSITPKSFDKAEDIRIKEFEDWKFYRYLCQDNETRLGFWQVSSIDIGGLNKLWGLDIINIQSLIEKTDDLRKVILDSIPTYPEYVKSTLGGNYREYFFKIDKSIKLDSVALSLDCVVLEKGGIER